MTTPSTQGAEPPCAPACCEEGCPRPVLGAAAERYPAPSAQGQRSHTEGLPVGGGQVSIHMGGWVLCCLI